MLVSSQSRVFFEGRASGDDPSQCSAGCSWRISCGLAGARPSRKAQRRRGPAARWNVGARNWTGSPKIRHHIRRCRVTGNLAPRPAGAPHAAAASAPGIGAGLTPSTFVKQAQEVERAESRASAAAILQIDLFGSNSPRSRSAVSTAATNRSRGFFRRAPPRAGPPPTANHLDKAGWRTFWGRSSSRPMSLPAIWPAVWARFAEHHQFRATGGAGADPPGFPSGPRWFSNQFQGLRKERQALVAADVIVGADILVRRDGPTRDRSPPPVSKVRPADFAFGIRSCPLLNIGDRSDSP